MKFVDVYVFYMCLIYVMITYYVAKGYHESSPLQASRTLPLVVSILHRCNDKINYVSWAAGTWRLYTGIYGTMAILFTTIHSMNNCNAPREGEGVNTHFSKVGILSTVSICT